MNLMPTQHKEDKDHSRLIVWIGLFVATVIGVYVIPKFGQIFADMLPGELFPWPTRIVMSAGTAGSSVMAVFGAALLILTDSWRRAPRLQGALVIALAFALGFTVVALLLPLMKLMEEAAA
jgi:type II secretory pathway component PulF